MSPISVSHPGDQGNQKESYTQLPDTDLDSIGRHCQLSYCNQLDFLPFHCSSCKGTFCLDHRSETAHKCPRAGEWARAQNPSPSPSSASSASSQKPTVYNSDQCAEISCKTLIRTLKDPGVTCPECRQSFCLKHRLREEHDCRPKKGGNNSGGAVGAAGAETLKSMFAKMRTWGKNAASTSTGGAGGRAGDRGMSRVAQVNAMKRSAKGDANVPVDKRVYLAVVGTSETTTRAATDPPRGEFWYDGRWKVGRVLDDAARRLQVENMNNRGGGEEERLRVFHVEGGVFLEFSDAIGEKVKSGDTVVLLRGAGVIL
ncbi:hypothetical protein BO94DRAFT_560694 [Aspergillus sclerotioniger CBS 115572]|uniref:AN1-type domain-containing protein n=1 Tax=Aspergillus sclerotioniger CBS 115572 TaxID=1450535 RepID=A0A317V6X8_9EURO|nr:hypothetical protein BO94DRAFT_560694 [Aspergillus sclerotioniger CBS 115572]PWY69856.1 hypothetical protein BO94DRAFT_560694 [Aspergillus sclerotioniger CBS 115572]